MLTRSINVPQLSRPVPMPLQSDSVLGAKHNLRRSEPTCRDRVLGKRKAQADLSQNSENVSPNASQPSSMTGGSCQPHDYHLQTSATKEPRGFPQTPVRGGTSRTIFLDPAHDSTEMTPTSTPVDHVTWNTNLLSSGTTDSDEQKAMGTVQGLSQKSASQPTVSKHFELNDGPSNSHVRPKSQGTSVVDPMELAWSRFLPDKQTPRKPTCAVPPKLLHSSSPPSPSRVLQRAGTSSLRRTKSCATDWPVSPAKRRKTGTSSSQVMDLVSGPTTKDLVGIIQGELQVSSYKRQIKTPIVSSPSVINEISRPAAPLLQLEQSQSGNPHDPLLQNFPDIVGEDTQAHSSSQGGKLAEHPVLQGRHTSPEFDDDDFLDVEMLEALEASVQDIMPQSGSLAALISTNHSPSNIQRLDGIGTQRRKNEPAESALAPSRFVTHAPNGEELQPNDRLSTAGRVEVSADRVMNHDEFDGYEDCDAADLESLFAKFEERHVDKSFANDASSGVHNEEDVSQGDPIQRVSMKQSAGTVRCTDIVSDVDEFGVDADFDELALECAHATQSVLNAGAPSTYSNNGMIHRYQIVTIAECPYVTRTGHKRQEKVLSVEEEQTKIRKVVTLRESWSDSPCSPGAFIHVIGKFDHQGHCTVDDSQNMLILHPDHLISATVVADSFSCTRRAVLQDRVKATNEPSEPQLYGNILHELFQEAMKANRWDWGWLQSTIQNITSRFLETLYEMNIETTQALERLMSKIPELQSWAEVFVTAQPKASGVVKDRNGTSAIMCINKLLDVEEHIWSPKYGLKGNVDATVQVVMRDGDKERTLTVPLEVKTGKNHSNAAHKAQTALYTLLLSDRYDVQIAYGILYYMETSDISRIPGVRHELRHMIMQRNQLACYVRQRLELPPMLKSPHLCGKCYAQTSCFIYHKMMDDGNGETSGMNERFDVIVRHLSPIHQQFFRKWDDLLTKEEKDAMRFRRELWTMLSSEREKVGRCFGNVVITPGSAVELTDTPRINRFRYTFVKLESSGTFSFTDSQIIVGEPIVISDEKGHFALANGYVTKVRNESITVAVDRRLHNSRMRAIEFEAETNQSFRGIMEVTEEGQRLSASMPRDPEDRVVYRIDKDEFSNGMATVRNNLIRMMERDLFGSEALRKLIIEDVAPTFRPHEATEIHTRIQSSLNIDQRNAIEKVLSARDYALVLGMPGTGKTTTIAHIIRALISKGKSILLTSYTHSAVDNILLKIRFDSIGILRIGAVAKVHPEVLEFANLAGVAKTTVEELKDAYGKQIVATTCLGINHPIFNQRTFDYCIVDEASQITLPVCLGPIRMAKTFILVGDHYQLPPLVQNKEAQQGGLDISLFKLLSDAHPSSVVNLEHQYRMCADIMSLSNNLIYNGRLKCGTSDVANRSITIPNMEALSAHHHTPATLPASQRTFCPSHVSGNCWIRNLIDPAIKVVFVNTDPLGPASREIARGSRITNPCEVALTTQLVSALMTVGVVPTDIGVITLYRSQLALLRQSLRSKPITNFNASGCSGGVEMHTADKFQGRDKEVVVLSLVRSNDSGQIGDLLKDWRRVNVALTRARTKLVICGSWETMSKGSELLRNFCGIVQEQGWRMDLQEGDLGGHYFEDSVTQCSAPRNAVDPVRQEISPGKKGVGNKNRMAKSPMKRQGIEARALLGSRPVMRDIMNDALG